MTSSALEFWLAFQNLIPPQTLGFQLGQAVLKVGALQPTTLHQQGRRTSEAPPLGTEMELTFSELRICKALKLTRAGGGGGEGGGGNKMGEGEMSDPGCFLSNPREGPHSSNRADAPFSLSVGTAPK